MNPGRYNRRVAAYEPIRTEQPSGEIIRSFADVQSFEFSAKVHPVSGSERLIGNQPLADMDTLIAAPWSPRMARIDATWRLRYRDTFYNISAPPVDVETEHREIQFACNSGKNNG